MPSVKDIPLLGFGLGFRGQHFSHVMEHAPAVDWFEIISENYMNTEGRAKSRLVELKERYPMVMHGVAMSIGSIDPLRSDYLSKLKKLIDWLQPAWISDHLCWTGIAHKNTHDLLPVPYTEEALKHITQRIREVQDVLQRPLVLENPSTYLEFTSSTMPEAEFIARMAEDSGCGLLLDVNNVYVTCYNHRLDPKAYIDALPLDRVAQIHLSGHSNKGTHIIDTHDDHVVDEVWALYRYVIHKAGLKNTMIEWDDNIPAFDVLYAELGKAKHAATYAAEYAPLPDCAGASPVYIPNASSALSEQQHTMQQAILAGDTDETSPAEAWIRSKAAFPAKAQLQVYINAYRWRLEDIVADDYPVLKYLLGDKKLDALVRSYVEATPSTFFDVAEYPYGFAAYVRTQCAEDCLAQEVAMLEAAIARLMHAPESEVLTQQHLAGITPEVLMQQPLLPRIALELYAFTHPVNRYYTAVMEEKKPDVPAAEVSYLAVYRHEDTMWRLPLEAEEYTLLSYLKNGMMLGDALEKLHQNTMLNEEEVTQRLGVWFARWMHNGLLAHLTEEQNQRKTA